MLKILVGCEPQPFHTFIGSFRVPMCEYLYATCILFVFRFNTCLLCSLKCTYIVWSKGEDIFGPKSFLNILCTKMRSPLDLRYNRVKRSCFSIVSLYGTHQRSRTAQVASLSTFSRIPESLFNRRHAAWTLISDLSKASIHRSLVTRRFVIQN